jgi:putative spermidine/putrescine transport system ATP-binding protein
MSSLTIDHLAKDFAGHRAVDDVNLEIAEGEFVTLLGPSGCGKTTLLRLIAGLETPDAGRVLLQGEDITHRPPSRRQMGMVFQSYALFPNLSVAGNVGFGASVAGWPRARIEARVAELLEMVRLAGLGARYPHQLSGGQQQRVALARALALRPAVLLLDEPLSALDALVRVNLRAEIRRVQQDLGITTIYVTHDQEEALAISDRVVLMQRGRLVETARPDQIYLRPSTAFAATFIGVSNQWSGVVHRNGATEVRCEGLTFALGEDVDLLPDQPVKVVVRPEEVRLLAEPAVSWDAANTFRGTVTLTQFLGPIIRVEVEVGGAPVKIDLRTAEVAPPRAGDQVHIRIPAQAIRVFDAETNEAPG